MRIICPSCLATYEVPQAIVATGRKLRCVKCAHDFQLPPSTGLPTPPLAVFSPPPASERPAPVPQRRSSHLGLAVASAWAASFAVLIGAGWAGVAWRGAIVQAWPPSARLYVAVGVLQR